MANSKVYFYDGQKAVNIDSLPPEAWVTLSGEVGKEDIEKLYSVVAWLYRCVGIRGHSVASMPFELRRGEEVVYSFDGITAQGDPPKEVAWVSDLPAQLGMVEVANILGGRAYLQDVKSVMKTTMRYKWLVPWSIIPKYDKTTGELLYFKRTFGMATRQPERLELEEVIQYWLPDYAVENGPAINYPGRAVLQNAGVIKGLDTFLASYFERGMVKASLLKYKDTLTPDEGKRVKEWWRRVFLGIANAFAAEVVRGDFEVITIGDGIKDLRDNKLNQDEKDSIAVGLGVPPSKLLPVGVNRATKDGDDRGYIEDTIIPEINWIYRVCNERMFNPLGYSIVALPQNLRVMQSDEVERANAFRAYVGDGKGNGLPVATAVEVLGIHVPDGFDVEQEKPEPPAILPIPQVTPQETIEEKTVSYFDLVDKRDERNQFLRWLDKRKGAAVTIEEFDAVHLTTDDKKAIYQQWQNDAEIDGLLNNYAKAMEQIGVPAD